MIYLIILLILFVGSVIYKKVATHFNILDTPNHRSSHIIPVIRGGGILFLIAILSYFAWKGVGVALYYFIASIILATISFIDDLRPLSPSIRFPIQLLCVGLVLYDLQLDFPLIVQAFLLIAGVAFLNAFNFMDGINGITGVYAMIVLSSLLAVNFVYEPFVDSNFIIFILLSLIVFAFYNFRVRARFFAGDVGSFTLGLAIMYLVFLNIQTFESPLILILLAVYGADSLGTILRRIKMKEKLSEAHRRHLYQMLVDTVKWSHMKVAVYYGIVQLLMLPIYIVALKLPILLQYVITLVVLICVFSIYFGLVYKIKRNVTS